jgi:ribosomal protein L13E
MSRGLPNREPNGRLRRAAQGLPRTRPEDVVAAAAKQPHRRGERSNVAATPWQRAIKAGKIRDWRHGGFTAGELEQAGLAFVEVREHYLRAIGAPRGFISRNGKGSDLPPSLRRKWLREWNEVGGCLAGSLSAAILAATEAHPELDERSWTREFTNAVSDALRSLARHFRI